MVTITFVMRDDPQEQSVLHRSISSRWAHSAIMAKHSLLIKIQRIVVYSLRLVMSNKISWLNKIAKKNGLTQVKYKVASVYRQQRKDQCALVVQSPLQGMIK